MNSNVSTSPEAVSLISSFEHAKDSGISSFNSDILELFRSFISYEKGKEMCIAYLLDKGLSESSIKKQLKEIPATNFMLMSLSERIPNWVDLRKEVKITYSWIYFSSSGSQIFVHYTPKIHSYLLTFSYLITTDTLKETDRMEYFLNLLKNRFRIPENPENKYDIKVYDRVNSLQYTWDPDRLDVLNKDTENWLRHFITWKNLDQICGINVRIFLFNLFGSLSKDIDTWTHVFFHDSGLYYRTNESSEIKFIQANDKYIAYFEIEETSWSFVLNSHKWIVKRKNLEPYEEFISKTVRDILNDSYTNVVTEHIDTSSIIDIFILEMKDNFWVSTFSKNLINFPELNEWNKLNYLIEVFGDIAPVIRAYFWEQMFFGKNPNYPLDASLSDIWIAFKRNQSEFLSPSFMKQFFQWWLHPDGTPIHSDVYIHECEYLQKYEQYYPFFMYVFFGRVFKKLLYLAKQDQYYKDILNTIQLLVQERLPGELQSLNRNGFNIKSDLARNTVFINYFMRYSSAYIMEKKWKPLKLNIPNDWRIFLRDKIFLDYTRIEG